MQRCHANFSGRHACMQGRGPQAPKPRQPLPSTGSSVRGGGAQLDTTGEICAFPASPRRRCIGLDAAAVEAAECQSGDWTRLSKSALGLQLTLTCVATVQSETSRFSARSQASRKPAPGDGNRVRLTIATFRLWRAGAASSAERPAPPHALLEEVRPRVDSVPARSRFEGPGKP